MTTLRIKRYVVPKSVKLLLYLYRLNFYKIKPKPKSKELCYVRSIL